MDNYSKVRKLTNSELIYISGAKVKSRKIINEDEEVDCLNKFGFTPVF